MDIILYWRVQLGNLMTIINLIIATDTRIDRNLYRSSSVENLIHKFVIIVLLVTFLCLQLSLSIGLLKLMSSNPNRHRLVK